MKTLSIFIFVLLLFGISTGADAPLDIRLIDGSSIKGRVISATASEVTVMSDLGVFRIPLEKLTPESKQAITQATKPDMDALLRRIAELEAKVSQLQQENESLRRGALSGPAPAARPPGGPAFAPEGNAPPAAGSFTISSTGKRHNSGCRFFGTGKKCGPTDGIACKTCGG
jgi:hypothetical protein